MIVVIDGPAGSGKSSTSKELAKIHQLNVLDSGAFYRACTLIALEFGHFEASYLLNSLEEAELTFREENGEIIISKADITLKHELRTPEISAHVSQVATIEEVRDWVNIRMRMLVENGKYIADGRDLGTVVFPNADLKIWLIASAEVRAQRRLQEMQKQGYDRLSYQDVLENIVERDRIDAARDTAPLAKASDAIEVDTSKLSFNEQVLIISSYISKLFS